MMKLDDIANNEIRHDSRLKKFLRNAVIYGSMLLGTAFASQEAIAQYNVSGTIRTLDDQVTGLPLANSKVSMDNGAIIAFTDSNGHYELTDIPAGTHTIAISKPNYKGFKKTLDIESNMTLNGCEPNNTQTNSLGTDTFTAAQFLEMYIDGNINDNLPFWKDNVVGICFKDTIPGNTVKLTNDLGIGPWQNTPANSMAHLMKRDLFQLVSESAAKDSGIIVYCNNALGYGTQIDGQPNQFIHKAECTMGDVIGLLPDHEPFGRGKMVISGSVLSRPSLMNPLIQDMTAINQKDLLLMELYDNFRKAFMRGEEDFAQKSIIDYSISVPLKDTVALSVNGGELKVQNTSDIQADRYRILVLDATSSVIIDTLTQRNDNRFNLPAGFIGSVKVQAINSLGTGPYSDAVPFSINKPNHKPNAVTLTLQNGEVVSYNDGKWEVNTNKEITDIDGDPVSDIIEIPEADYKKNIPRDGSGIITLDSMILAPGTRNTIKFSTTDGYDTVPATNSGIKIISPLGTTYIIQPLPNSIDKQPITIIYRKTVGATNYKTLISQDTLFNNPKIINSADTIVAADGLEAEKIYYIAVEPSNSITTGKRSNIVEITTDKTGIDNIANNNIKYVKVYPTQCTKGYINVEYNYNKPVDVDLRIISLDGKIRGEIKQKVNSSTTNQIDLSRLGTGMYLIQAQATSKNGEKIVETYKIIKQ